MDEIQDKGKLPWIVEGDYNVARFREERKGGMAMKWRERNLMK